MWQAIERGEECLDLPLSLTELFGIELIRDCVFSCLRQLPQKIWLHILFADKLCDVEVLQDMISFQYFLSS